MIKFKRMDALDKRKTDCHLAAKTTNVATAHDCFSNSKRKLVPLRLWISQRQPTPDRYASLTPPWLLCCCPCQATQQQFFWTVPGQTYIQKMKMVPTLILNPAFALVSMNITFNSVAFSSPSSIDTCLNATIKHRKASDCTTTACQRDLFCFPQAQWSHLCLSLVGLPESNVTYYWMIDDL